jgi:hypothetical protein
VPWWLHENEVDHITIAKPLSIYGIYIFGTTFKKTAYNGRKFLPAIHSTGSNIQNV